MNQRHNNQDAADSLLQQLLSQLRLLSASEGYAASTVVDLEKSRTILEATAGNVHLAAQLYWDDFLATRHHDDVAAAADAAAPEEEAEPPLRPLVVAPEQLRVRRSLEREFDQHNDNDDQVPRAGDVGLANNNNYNNNNNNRRELEEDGANYNEDHAHVAGLAARAAQAFLAAAQHDESASVSDDETGQNWRKMVGGIAARLLDDPTHGGGSAHLSPQRKRRKMEGAIKKEKEDDEDDIDKKGYLSESDWLWESLLTRDRIPLCTPFDLLWGLSPSRTSIRHDSVNPSADDSNAVAGEGDDPPPAAEAGAHNVIVEEDEVEDEESEAVSLERPGIPRQWLNAGFALSSDGSGLLLKSPTEEDISFFSWQNERDNGTVRVSPPPPYHCSSVTAILAIVNGLIYTGATYQTGRISCTSTREPFNELTELERKRQFETRLTDALALLLHIAADASKKRKLQALQGLKRSKDPTDQRKWQKLENKLDLCPTCWWETDSNGAIRFPQGRDLDRDILVATSYTNKNDLREYVVSNMRSFTARGGCALFLETILRIHGKGAVMRMMALASRDTHRHVADGHALIHCTCEEESKKQNGKEQLKLRTKTKELMEKLPTGHDCMSLELISLLLTGKVYSTFKGWSAGHLGLGILSSIPGEVCKGLTRPEKPVWVLCGPKIYSLLVLTKCYDQPEHFARADQPDSMVELMHFAFWPNHQHKTPLRLSPNRPKWSPSTATFSKMPPSQPSGAAFHLKRRLAAVASAADLHQTERVESELLVKQEQLEVVHTNPDDVKLYPDMYRLWRYHIEDNDDDENDGGENKKMRATEWVPFHRLSNRQKLLVETKLGPQINRILWTRWPRASIAGFEPERPPPLV